MKKTLLFIGLLTFGLLISGKAQENMDYDKAWDNLKKYEQKGLPQSALKVADSIFRAAVTEKDNEQVMKSMIYRIKLSNYYQEDQIIQAIESLQSDKDMYEPEVRAFMHLLSARLYSMYYKVNRWSVDRRTSTGEHREDDIKTWTQQDFFQLIDEEHQSVLAYKKQLGKIPITKYPELIKQDEYSEKIQPALYDFFAHEIADYYKSRAENQNQGMSVLSDSNVFLPARLFLASDYTLDSTEAAEKAMAVLKDLLGYRVSEDHTYARVYTDLKRLEIAAKYYSGKDAKDQHFHALSRLHMQFENSPVISEIDICLAKWYFNKAEETKHVYGENKKAGLYEKCNEICRQIKSNHPETRAAGQAIQLQNKIKKLHLSFTAENNVIPDQPFPVFVEYKNMDKLNYSIMKIDPDEFSSIVRKHYGEKRRAELLKNGEIIRSKKLELPGKPDYVSHTTEFISDALPGGFYVLFLSTQELDSEKENFVVYKPLQVTNIAWYTRQISRDESLQLFVTNSKTGMPTKGAKVKASYRTYNYKAGDYKYEKLSQTRTSAKGMAEFNLKRRSHSLVFEIDNGKEILRTDPQYHYMYSGQNEKWRETTRFFTDRAVYRPGQTIHVKGICLQQKGKNYEILENYTSSLSFLDPNHQNITTKTIKTNEFGSFSAELVIPEGLLNGRLTIKTPSGSQYVQLEEYKRPAFEVEMDDPDGNYLLGRRVTLEGSAVSYTGAKLSGADVKYRVYREPVFHSMWRFGYLPQQRELMTHGETQCDKSGSFDLSFVPRAIADYPVDQDVSYRFTLEAEVTDITGETQSVTRTLVVGYRTLKLSTSLPSSVDLSQLDSLTVSSTNLNSQSVETSGTIVIYELHQPDKVLIEKDWDVPEFSMVDEEEWRHTLPNHEYRDEGRIENFPVKEKRAGIPFNTANSETYALPSAANITPGAYRIELRATDEFGMPVVDKQYIRVYDNSTSTPGVSKALNVHTEKSQYSVGEVIDIDIASSLQNARVLVNIEHEDKTLHDDWLKLKNSGKRLSYDVTEELRGGITVSAILIYEGEMYQQSKTLTVPFDNKKLKLEYLHFRNELMPGESEEIRVKISGWKKDAAAAEMLATMYDASLDALYENNFSFNLYHPEYKQANYTTTAFQTGNASFLINEYEPEHAKVEGMEPVMNMFGLNYYGNYATTNMREARSDGVLMSAASGEAEMTDEMGADSPQEETLTSEDGMKDAEKSASNEEMPAEQGQEKAESGDVKIRKDFNETAFFLPQLRTNEKGEISFSFTSPESLTAWKFLAMAHTKDLSTIVSENKMVTRKKLMIVPNMPRFFRENDEMTLSVKISNLSEEALNGNVELGFLDALSGEDITDKVIASEQQPGFEIDAGDNTAVKFTLNIPHDVQAVEYKLIARTDKYGDGEQKVVPVLSNRMLVTESMPMYVNGNSTKKWTFDKLKKSKSSGTLKHHKLSLEVTPRPAWYAIQALPYLMEYPYECSEQVFSRYYANSLAEHIANSDPQIRRIFDSWKNLPESDALSSNLHKNQDLKANMLEQTPWVLEAQNEAERKRRIGLLFDMDRMAREQFSALKKLQQKQVSSGGWPWFEGMPESRFITQHIVAGLNHLKKLNVLDDKQIREVDPMIKSGLNYLDKQIKKDYDYLTSTFDEDEMKDKHISNIHVHYLYTRSFNHGEIPISPQTSKAYKYYYNQAREYWVEMNNYSKAMIALLMHRTGNEDVADDILASLREYAILDDELGMYWKNSGGYYWYQAPVESQALLIEAFDEAGDDRDAVERMKQWLLNQKRTQDWKTTKATAEAVYALILTGQNLLDTEAGVIVEMGGETIDPEEEDDVTTEAGTGYFRKDWSGGEITSEMSKVKLTKSGSGMAWGALHWQYFEDMDKITSHETPLQLEKKLFKKIDTDEGTELKLLDDKTTLSVGDKLVARIILRSDRDMEYVHMKDMRAAALEPLSTRSGYRYQDGLGYYESVRDASVDFFFSRLRKGTYVFEYPLYVTHAGEFSNGITNIQCMYAPEYNAHSQGDRIHVE